MSGLKQLILDIPTRISTVISGSCSLLEEQHFLCVLLIWHGIIFYPALTANDQVARNNGLEVVGRPRQPGKVYNVHS
jgi:hypothetical protein